MYPAPPVTSTEARSAANGEIGEAQRAHVLGRIDIAAVEDNRRSHQLAHLREVWLTEFVPFRHDCQGVGARQRLVALLAEGHAASEQPARRRPGLRIVRSDDR